MNYLFKNNEKNAPTSINRASREVGKENETAILNKLIVGTRTALFKGSIVKIPAVIPIMISMIVLSFFFSLFLI